MQCMAMASSPFKWDVRGSFGARKPPGRCQEAHEARYLQGMHLTPCKCAVSPLTAYHHPQPVNNTTMKQKSTHHHCCEPLLAGWIVGVNGHITGVQRGNDNGNDHQHDARIAQHPPPHCELLLADGIMGANSHVITTMGA